MYDNHLARTAAARRTAFVSRIATALAFALGAAASNAQAQDFESGPIVRKIGSLSEKLELTTNTSRILTLDKNIPRVQVNNPELLAVTPLSATQIQISAKKTGVTQVNLWDEEGNIHTVDVMVYGDARELSAALRTQFPHSSIKVYRYSESLVLTGFVDRPDHVGPIMRLAEDYAPKVINNINVGGVQQILLKVKIMEVNRAKLRDLGVDWGHFSSSGVGAVSSVSGLISEVAQVTRGADTATPNVEGGPGVINNLGVASDGTFQFGVIDGRDTFLGFIRFLQQNQVAKVLAEPNIVAVSGRPAQFVVGGEVPILVPQSLGTISIEYKKIGTIVDFLPIVLGNGNIRLEVRPEVSARNDANGIILEGTLVPGFNTRRVDTAVEMKAGQTFALAGLIEEDTVSSNNGIPYLSDMPILGVPFRRTESTVIETELLIVVTPEFVDPLDSHQAPCGGPGTYTTYPNNRDLYCGGHVEVPLHCNPTTGLSACGDASCTGNGCVNGCQSYGPGGQFQGNGPMITDGLQMPGGVGYDESYEPTMAVPGTIEGQEQAPQPGATEAPDQPMSIEADGLQLPNAASTGEGVQPADGSPPSASGQPPYWSASRPQYTAPRPYSPLRQPVFSRNASNPNNPSPASGGVASKPGETGLIGPVGYDPQ